jgi:sec-independent protein translocase protein TatB
MFDFDAGKLLIIGVVALVVIGPKELPGVMRQFGQAVAKLRRMAAEFQSQFMEAMREAELEDLKKELASVQEAAKIDVDFDPVDDVKREMTAAITPPQPAPLTPQESTAVPPEPSATVAGDAAGATAAPKADGAAALAASHDPAETAAAKAGEKATAPPTPAAMEGRPSVPARPPPPAPALATQPVPNAAAAAIPASGQTDAAGAGADTVGVGEAPAKTVKRKTVKRRAPKKQSVAPDQSTNRENPSASAAVELAPDRRRSKT